MWRSRVRIRPKRVNRKLPLPEMARLLATLNKPRAVGVSDSQPILDHGNRLRWVPGQDVQCLFQAHNFVPDEQPLISLFGDQAQGVCNR